MTAQVTLPPIVKQLYTRAKGVPQVGRACWDPLGVWEDFFECLHLELTSFLTHDIMNNGKEGTRAGAGPQPVAATGRGGGSEGEP